MIRIQLITRATVAILVVASLAACNYQKTDFPALPPVTEVTITDYGTPSNSFEETVWKITDAQKIARLSALVDAQSAGWTDMNSANISLQTGVELKLKGPNLKRTFVVYRGGFDNAYSTARGNLWATEGEYPNVTIDIVIKEISDSAIEKLRADIKAATQGVKPEPTETPAPTPKASPKAATK